MKMNIDLGPSQKAYEEGLHDGKGQVSFTPEAMQEMYSTGYKDGYDAGLKGVDRDVYKEVSEENYRAGLREGTKRTLALFFPLQPATKEVQIKLDWDRQRIGFKEAGRKRWKWLALWFVYEQCEANELS